MHDTNATRIGDDVTIGHAAVVHGCTVGNRVLIGMGAILLNGATIGDDSIVAAGALVPEDMHVPAGSLVMGVPARVRRALSDRERQEILESAANYVRYRLDYVR
jgi:carbonic anhydrase/acetyltransferase-like protein (isoleucine patch superfamily)